MRSARCKPITLAKEAAVCPLKKDMAAFPSRRFSNGAEDPYENGRARRVAHIMVVASALEAKIASPTTSVSEPPRENPSSANRVIARNHFHPRGADKLTP